MNVCTIQIVLPVQYEPLVQNMLFCSRSTITALCGCIACKVNLTSIENCLTSASFICVLHARDMDFISMILLQ